jgi:predicted HicB family RNase H-like nuclease
MKEKVTIEIDSNAKRRLIDKAHYKNLSLNEYIKLLILNSLK